MTFTIPIRTVSEANAHEHWRNRQKRAKAQRAATYLTVFKSELKRHPEVTITLTRISPGTLDDDNLPSSMKHIRDELAAMMDLPNDRHPSVTWKYDQAKGKPREYAVRVEVTPRGT